MQMTKKAVNLEQIARLYSTANLKDPLSVVVEQKVGFRTRVLATLVLVFSLALSLYQNLLPVSIVRSQIWTITSNTKTNLNTPNIQPWSFSTTAAVPPAYNGSVNLGPYQPLIYFSKLPTHKDFYLGFNLRNATIMLNGEFPAISSLNKLSSIGDLPAMCLSIQDYTYTIYDQTAYIPGTSRTFGAYTLPDEPLQTSNLTIDSSVDKNCFKTMLSPWKSCTVPDRIPFRMVQRLPLFDGAYSDAYQTNVFRLRKSDISSVTESAYVLTGTLVFDRTVVKVERSLATNALALTQTNVTKFGSDQMELLYSYGKLSTILAFEQNMGDKWSLLHEFKMNVGLIKDYQNYSTADLVVESSKRIAIVSQYWLKQMSNDVTTLGVNLINGELKESIFVGFSLVTGGGVMILYLLVILMMLISIRKANKKVKSHPLIKQIWENPYGLIFLNIPEGDLTETMLNQKMVLDEKEDSIEVIPLKKKKFGLF